VTGFRFVPRFPFSSSDLCGLCGLGVVFFFHTKNEEKNHTETAETAEIGRELKLGKRERTRLKPATHTNS
jgi:hypothetical protein